MLGAIWNTLPYLRNGVLSFRYALPDESFILVVAKSRACPAFRESSGISRGRALAWLDGRCLHVRMQSTKSRHVVQLPRAADRSTKKFAASGDRCTNRAPPLIATRRLRGACSDQAGVQQGPVLARSAGPPARRGGAMTIVRQRTSTARPSGRLGGPVWLPRSRSPPRFPTTLRACTG